MFIIQSNIIMGACESLSMCEVMCVVILHAFITRKHITLSIECVENAHLIGVESYACWQILWHYRVEHIDTWRNDLAQKKKKHKIQRRRTFRPVCSFGCLP